MRAWIWTILYIAMPVAVAATENKTENYGVGLLCPRQDTQVSFYTEDNQQDAAGTLSFQPGAGFTVSSDTVKNLESRGAVLMQGSCDGGLPALRIDAKRDGWLEAGSLWLPPNQEWDYADWQDYLHKASVWKPLGPVTLYQGSMEVPDKAKPYPQLQISDAVEIYPLKFTDDGYALVILDNADAFTKNCSGAPVPPEGKLGWMRLSDDAGKAAAVPAHSKGC